MEKVKWGVLGTAYIFERDTARGMKLAENCELTAIAGRSAEKAQEFKERYGFRKVYGTYEELLDDPEIEAVYIPLPNTLHYEWTIKALERGKHVLCEKPLAPNRAQAREMFDAAKKNKVFLMEAFAYLHSPYIKEIRGVIESGTIGEVRYAEAALITSGYRSSNIRVRRETLGGGTYDVGVYALSFIQHILKEEPEKVHASGIFSEEKIDLFSTGILEYKGGARAHFDCGMVLETEKHAALNRFQIHGSKGTLVSENFAFNAPGTLSYRVRTFGGEDKQKTVEVPNNYCLEVEQLGRCIQNGETPYVTGEFSLSLAHTVDRVLEKIGY